MIEKIVVFFLGCLCVGAFVAVMYILFSVWFGGASCLSTTCP